MDSPHGHTNRALVVRLDSMGDVLLAGPAVRAVAASANCTMLTSTRGAPAARMLPGVSAVIAWDCPWITAPTPDFSAIGLLALAARLRARRFDEAIILTSERQSALPSAVLARLGGCGRITAVSDDRSGSLVDVRIRSNGGLPVGAHESRRNLAIAAHAGYGLPMGDDGELRVRGPRHDPSAAHRYVVVHPGASAPARRWAAEHFARLVRLLAEQGTPVVVTGTADERPLLAECAGSDAIVLDSLSLPQLARVIAGAAAIVIGNTGPAHLAAALGTPVVSLHAPVVSEQKWGPRGGAHIVLGDQAEACAGTYWTECALPGHPCLNGVRPEDVAEAVRSVGQKQVEVP